MEQQLSTVLEVTERNWPESIRCCRQFPPKTRGNRAQSGSAQHFTAKWLREQGTNWQARQRADFRNLPQYSTDSAQSSWTDSQFPPISNTDSPKIRLIRTQPT